MNVCNIKCVLSNLSITIIIYYYIILFFRIHNTVKVTVKNTVLNQIVPMDYQAASRVPEARLEYWVYHSL